MARHRMTAKRKVALRKAQLVSARKRRGKGHYVKKAAVAGALVGVSAAAIYGGRKAYKSRSVKGQTKEAAPGATKYQKQRASVALLKKQGRRPEGKKVLLTHRTPKASDAKKIVSTRQWKTDLMSVRSGGQGWEGHSWFTSEHGVLDKRTGYGTNRIQVLVPRGKIALRRSAMSNVKGQQWYMVSNDDLRKAQHKLVGGRKAKAKTKLKKRIRQRNG